jgi:hypothetical protein
MLDPSEERAGRHSTIGEGRSRLRGFGQGDIEYCEARRVVFRGGDRVRGPMAIYLDDGSGAGVLVVIGMSLREHVL